ncbi:MULTISPECIES: DUF2829 domain-containing protein [Pseudomonas]|jgi:hypothetical protein|uniref:Thoeris anti-defense 2-like domain-containing protein n=1 Tax=Pseudomonas phage phiAH14a TaxID=1805958 RepID=A0A1B0VMG3_9CAUD|nr:MULTISPECIES: DUF2829 domain-containing protein [Pseudomonas]YP_010773081.1 hypothetical protein QIT80_gp64 [Pseudomonas phage phiAH14a]AMW64524.1 hypothetical protein AH14a_p64 [Pseudomonas phage phiAH14a]KAA0946656.1 DUF2829 domain-containing protein [Pseudomonas sp. ANT_H4]KAA0953243.1 DUF2829 domain-containing protein [Pseudomonas sp. ANT_H14]MBM1184107.1 DUF2829 domain-containing protein [Pseudomonas lundensis]
MTQLFIGTKIILALAMTRLAYNEYRGWTLPADENGADDGYLVEYTDGGASNHPDHAGYISWSPKAQFDNAYRPTAGMSFGLAVEALKLGKRVSRVGWNGKGMWLKLVPADLADTVSFQHEALRPLPWIGMKTADQCFVPWLASQTDVLADDWQLID